jgi:hypothetical protein
MNILTSLGMLEWYRASPPANRGEETYVQHPLSRERRSSSSSADQQIPRRLTTELSTLGIAYRRVLLLVDGTRSAQQIAKILGRDPEEILGILRELQSRNFITL